MVLKDSPAASVTQPIGVPGALGWTHLKVPPYLEAVVGAGVVEAGTVVAGLAVVVGGMAVGEVVVEGA
jgi:hypothetical protein